MIVVIALLSIILLFSMPRFQGTVLQDSRQKTVRWVVYTVKKLRQDAVKHQKIHTLHVEMGDSSMWVSNEAMTEEEAEDARQERYEFPDHTEIAEVAFPDGEKTSFGRADIRFYPKGYSDRAMIHLQVDDDEEITLRIEPFLPNISVYDAYEEFDQ
jgi:hypothetical protein